MSLGQRCGRYVGSRRCMRRVWVKVVMCRWVMLAWYEWRRREGVREEEEGLRSPPKAENWIFRAFAGLVEGSKHRNRIQRVGICRFPRSNRSICEEGCLAGSLSEIGPWSIFFFEVNFFLRLWPAYRCGWPPENRPVFLSQTPEENLAGSLKKN